MNSPKEVALNYLNACETKAKLPFGRMFVLAILAGMFIAVGGLAAGVGSATLAGSAARLVSGAVFPAGLAMVLIAGSELFTGNSLMIMGVLSRRITVGGMLRNYVVVWLGNLVGAMLDLMTNDGEVLTAMCEAIVTAKKAGIYDGAYNVIKLAVEGKF